MFQPKVVLSGYNLVRYIQLYRDSNWPMPWFHDQIHEDYDSKDLYPHITFTLYGDWARMFKANHRTGVFKW